VERNVLPVNPLVVAKSTIQMHGHQSLSKYFGLMQKMNNRKNSALRRIGIGRIRECNPNTVQRGNVLPTKSNTWNSPFCFFKQNKTNNKTKQDKTKTPK
jgi:hypothetical protein